MTGFLIDLILLGIVLITVIVSAKRGFMRSLVETVGFAVALIAAICLSNPLAGMVYDRAIAPAVVTAVDGAIDDSTQNALDSAWSALPKFITNNADKIGFSKEKLSQKIGDLSDGTTDKIAQSASQNIIRPIIVKITGILFAIIIFVLLLILVKVSAVSLNKLFSFSIIGKMNTLLGGLLGVVKGLVFAVAASLVIQLLLGFLPGGASVLDLTALKGSTLFKTILSILPFAGK